MNITEEVVLEALCSIAWNVFVLGVVIVLLTVLIPIFLVASTDALLFNVFINDTPSDLVLDDLAITHGKVLTGFGTQSEVTDPLDAIIPGRVQFLN